MAKNVARFMLERLNEWGVKRIYGYPGDGINAMLGAFHEVEDRVEFIQTAHEELAAFAATAHAKLTDEVGVCMATSGPGAIHLLNGPYDAKLDHRPVVSIYSERQERSRCQGADSRRPSCAWEGASCCSTAARARRWPYASAAGA